MLEARRGARRAHGVPRWDQVHPRSDDPGDEAGRASHADRAGWFDGNATNLFPLSGRARAAKLVRLIGGAKQVLARGREALAAREFEWAAELADYVLANDDANASAKRIKAQALAC